MAQAAHDSAERAAIDKKLARIGRVLMILSGKGGVGKSTVAVNLAAALSRQGKTVGLLDIDVHGPSIPGMLGLAGTPVQAHENGILPVESAPRLKVMSVGFLVENAADAVIWRGPMKHGVIKQLLTDVDWGDLDYLIVDAPPGTGDEPLTIAQFVGAAGEAVIVTTPQRVAVDDVRRSVSFCRNLGVPVAGIVENMSGFVCPHCGKTSEIFSSDGGRALADEMKVLFLGAIPLDPAVGAASDAGAPFMLPDSATSQAFHHIVDEITTSRPSGHTQGDVS